LATFSRCSLASSFLALFPGSSLLPSFGEKPENKVTSLLHCLAVWALGRGVGKVRACGQG